jgi:predicted TIM-barrel fold metal-dependent hydrolase
MQTPWGQLDVVDAHVHFFSRGFFQLLAKQKEGLSLEQIGATLGWEMPPADPQDLARRWAGELDRCQVAGGALIASLPGDESSVEAAVLTSPDRFHGYFMVNPLAPGAAVRQPGVPCLFPAMHRYSLHDPAVIQLLDTLATAANPVAFVHCGVLSVGIRDKLGLASPFDMRFSNPVDVHHLAKRYPKIRFSLPHFGAGYLREALMVCDLCPNVYLDTSSSNKWMRLEGLTLETVFRRALDVAGPSRLLFGTDSSFFPRGWHRAVFDAQVEALGRIGVSQPDARAILGENLLRLLKG